MRDKTEGLAYVGRAPEIICYMAMSLRMSPSLTRAITFAAKNLDGPAATGLERVLWNVYMRRFHCVEDSFGAFAEECGEHDEGLKRALLSLKRSTEESTKEGLDRDLEKATRIVFRGTKKRMEEFASSLATPTTVLFALGILLPMMFGAMLPMLSLGALDLSYSSPSAGLNQPQSGMNPILIVLVMDVSFPLMALLYARSILAKRPQTGEQPHIRRGEFSIGKLGIAISAGLVACLSGFLLNDWYSPYLLIAGLTVPVSAYLISTSYVVRKRTARILKMEREFPDTMYHLGNRIAEGIPPERAVLETAKAVKDTENAEVLNRAHYRMVVFGLTLENALLGERGVLNDVPSRMMWATMRSFVEMARKDSITAGKMLVKTSEHLRDMQRLEEDTRRKLRTSTESMRMTSLLFAPIVMGITFSLYTLLVETFARVSSGGGMMTPEAFLIVLGTYLVLMAAISMYFVSSIEKGKVQAEQEYSIGAGILICVSVFLVSCIIGQIVMT